MVRHVLGSIILLMTIAGGPPPAIAQNRIEATLIKSLAATPLENLRIRFSSDGLPYGTTVEMEIRGDGSFLRYDRQGLELTALENRGRLDPERLKPLLRLLLDIKVWQDVPLTRVGVPDEGMTSVKVSAGATEATISEWQNDMKSQQRLIKVKHEMYALVPTGARSCVLVPKPPTPKVYAKMHAIAGACDGLD
jgi:hypothetical protein